MFKLSKNNHLYFITTKTKGYTIYKTSIDGDFATDRYKQFTDKQKAIIKKYLKNN